MPQDGQEQSISDETGDQVPLHAKAKTDLLAVSFNPGHSSQDVCHGHQPICLRTIVSPDKAGRAFSPNDPVDNELPVSRMNKSHDFSMARPRSDQRGHRNQVAVPHEGDHAEAMGLESKWHASLEYCLE